LGPTPPHSAKPEAGPPARAGMQPMQPQSWAVSGQPHHPALSPSEAAYLGSLPTEIQPTGGHSAASRSSRQPSPQLARPSEKAIAPDRSSGRSPHSSPNPFSEAAGQYPSIGHSTYGGQPVYPNQASYPGPSPHAGVVQEPASSTYGGQSGYAGQASPGSSGSYPGANDASANYPSANYPSANYPGQAPYPRAAQPSGPSHYAGSGVGPSPYPGPADYLESSGYAEPASANPLAALGRWRGWRYIELPRKPADRLGDAVLWVAAAAILRVASRYMLLSMPMLSPVFTVLMLAPAGLALYLAFCAPKTGWVPIYRLFLVMIGLLLGGKL
jgi:hypothetical protein